MTRIITVISGKGGVGKTTAVTNLGAALVKKGHNVIIIDANVTTPNLSLHLGIPFYPRTLHDVLKNNVNPEDALYVHSSGLKILPASLSADAIKEEIALEKLEKVLINLLGKADIIIVDAAAGLGREAKAAIDIADEILVVTNPELPAVTDSLKTIELSRHFGTKVFGVVVNRRKNEKYELIDSDIEAMLNSPIVATIPEDNNVPRSIAAKKPVVTFRPSSKASVEFKNLAARLMGERISETKAKGWFERLFFWLS